jgi:uncharacterized Tic20 family protein
MLRFVCSSCGKNLSAPEERAGEERPCPFCGQKIQVPAIAPPHAAAVPNFSLSDSSAGIPPAQQPSIDIAAYMMKPPSPPTPQGEKGDGTVDLAAYMVKEPSGQQPRKSADDERTTAMMCHLMGLLFGILGCLVVWLIKKDESEFVDDQGKEAVNFHLSLLIYVLVTIPVIFVTCGVGVVLTLAVAIFGWVMGIIAAIAANKGERYRYPLTIRMIS